MRENEATLFRDYTHSDVLKPENVTVGKSVCYYDIDRKTYAYLKLFSDKEMGLAFGNGTCPSSFPAQYEVWER